MTSFWEMPCSVIEVDRRFVAVQARRSNPGETRQEMNYGTEYLAFNLVYDVENDIN
jgi:hypothetical protein